MHNMIALFSMLLTYCSRGMFECHRRRVVLLPIFLTSRSIVVLMILFLPYDTRKMLLLVVSAIMPFLEILLLTIRSTGVRTNITAYGRTNT